MAQRRMMSLRIIDTDQFMDMPLSTQCLYFHLMIRADDDGFVGKQKKIMRMIGSNEDDMFLLINRGFVIQFDTGVCVISHWRVHNFIPKDRYSETIYLTEKELTMYDNMVYKLYDNLDTQVRLELELELGKDKKKLSPSGREKEPENFKLFYEEYPRKRERADALKAWKTHKAKIPDINTLLTALRAWKKTDDWTREGGQFIPYPGKWIRRSGWLDEIPDHIETAEERRQRIINAI